MRHPAHSLVQGAASMHNQSHHRSLYGPLGDCFSVLAEIRDEVFLPSSRPELFSRRTIVGGIARPAPPPAHAMNTPDRPPSRKETLPRCS
jgi:hypothetical protein